MQYIYIHMHWREDNISHERDILHCMHYIIFDASKVCNLFQKLQEKYNSQLKQH